MTAKVLVLIPARYQSTRFPGKPLISIAGKSLIQRVYENCVVKITGQQQIELQACVVTDDPRIETHVQQFKGQVCRVDDNVESGSERIFLAYQRFFAQKGYDLVMNLQGDEPLMTAEQLLTVAQAHLQSSWDIFTLVRRMKGGDSADFLDSNKVKVALAQKAQANVGQCLYFSRASIPFVREQNGSIGNEEWYWHVGLYSFRPQSLQRFFTFPLSRLEKLEKLEQLRALENGMTIGAVMTDRQYCGVDVPQDVAIVERLLAQQKTKS